MTTILHIDTTQYKAFIAISQGKNILFQSEQEEYNQHSEFLFSSLEKIQKEYILLKDLNAVSVCVGPGSYTGIRVSLSAVLALSKVAHIPIIPLNSLEIVMSCYASEKNENQVFVPLLHARENEVFMSQYNSHFETTLEPHLSTYSKLLEKEESQLQYLCYENELEIHKKKLLGRKLNGLTFKVEYMIERALSNFSKNKIVNAENLTAYYLKDVYVNK